MEVGRAAEEDIRLHRIQELALEWGFLREGWSLRDYLVDAVRNMGYETVVIWGPQGVGKSSFMLTTGYWILQDWDEVLDCIVFTPQQLIERFRRVGRTHRFAWIGWDDVLVHFPGLAYKFEAKLYAAVDSVWAVIRTKASVITLTIPVIDRLPKNIRDNVTFEVFIGRNRRRIIRRWFRLPALDEPASTFFKIPIERGVVDLNAVPRDVFRQYWDRRLQLAEEALGRLETEISGVAMGVREGDGDPIRRMIVEETKRFLEGLEPGYYQPSWIAEKVSERLGIKVSPNQIGRIARKLGYTGTKKSWSRYIVVKPEEIIKRRGSYIFGGGRNENLGFL